MPAVATAPTVTGSAPVRDSVTVAPVATASPGSRPAAIAPGAVESPFRGEALANRRLAELGGVRLSAPPAFRLLALAAGLCTAGIGVLGWHGEYTRQARLPGVVIPRSGLLRVSPPETAVLVARHVDEGMQVSQGEVLATLSVERNSSRGPLHAAVVRELGRQRASLVAQRQRLMGLAELEEAALERRRQVADRELALVDRELELQRSRVAGASELERQVAALADARFVSAAALLQRKEESLERRLTLAALERSRESYAGQQAAFEHDRHALPIRHAERLGAVEREIAALDERLHAAEARREIVLRAPRGGRIGTVSAEAGQQVAPGAPVMVITPEDELEAHLFAPARSAGFVRPGQAVRLRYTAYPYQKFGLYAGTVRAVSPTSLAPGDLPPAVRASIAGTPAFGSLLAANEAVFRIVVAIVDPHVVVYGRREPLRADIPLEADIAVDRRRLVEWVFDPLLAASGRL